LTGSAEFDFEDRMGKIRSICVYCGSSDGADPRFVETARALCAAMARAGIRLVYGGGNGGLMGEVARAIIAGGGEVSGVIPRFLVEKEKLFTEAQDITVVNNMHERKQLMFEKADAFVTLPGGIGTLEELAEQLTWVQLDRHGKPVLIADIAGFWKPLLSLFAHMNEQGFLRPGYELRYLVAERVTDILPMLEAAAARRALEAEMAAE
jgi:uncharacterized protein (TIGR00730 family)